MNKKNNKRLFLSKALLLIGITIVIGACSESALENLAEDVVGDVIDGTDFTATVNGTDFGTSIANVSAQITVNSGVYAIALGAGDAEGISKLKAIALAMSGFDFESLEAGRTWNTMEDEQGNAGAGYEEDIAGNETGDDVSTDTTTEIFIRITAIDKEAKLISGEFNFVAIDEDNGITYNVTDGKFESIPYTLN